MSMEVFEYRVEHMRGFMISKAYTNTQKMPKYIYLTLKKYVTL